MKKIGIRAGLAAVTVVGLALAAGAQGPPAGGFGGPGRGPAGSWYREAEGFSSPCLTGGGFLPATGQNGFRPGFRKTCRDGWPSDG